MTLEIAGGVHRVSAVVQYYSSTVQYLPPCCTGMKAGRFKKKLDLT